MTMGVPSDVDIRSLCSQACQATSAPFQVMTRKRKGLPQPAGYPGRLSRQAEAIDRKVIRIHSLRARHPRPE